MHGKFNEVGTAFGLPGRVSSYEAITNGHINATYKVVYAQDCGEKAYLFQKVNTNVFRSPVMIMENIDLVTTYMRKEFPDQASLHFYRTDGDVNYFVCSDGGFWRVMDYVDSVTLNSCDDLITVENTGKMFGRFQMQLAGLDGTLLHETIPNFHNTRMRFDTLFADVERDICGRVCEVGDEIAYLASVRERVAQLSDRVASGEIPTRVTHNDTKSNNILFDKQTLEPLVVIDLDTIMPGAVAYDFGDAIRSIANTAAEDEAELSKVSLDIEKFRAFARGFVSETHSALDAVELDSLVLGAFTMTVELVARFLDDYITGDTYFRCGYPAHNLVRARCQMKLAMDIERKWDELEGVIREIIKEV